MASHQGHYMSHLCMDAAFMLFSIWDDMERSSSLIKNKHIFKALQIKTMESCILQSPIVFDSHWQSYRDYVV